MTAGEFLGFCVPALVGAVVLNRSGAIALPALIAAGFIEGAVLGWSQARVLRRLVPDVSTRRWVLGTAAAAAAAWLLGLLPSTMHASWSRWPVAVVVPAAVVLGAALLCTIGVVQWLELRRHLPRAGRWIAATAVAWCLGLLAFTAITSPLWQPGQDLVLIVVIGAVGGLAMAATMAAVTGWALVRLVRPSRDGNRESAASPALPCPKTIRVGALRLRNTPYGATPSAPHLIPHGSAG